MDCQGLNLGDQGIAYVGEAFAYNDALTSVDLSNNGIGPDGEPRPSVNSAFLDGGDMPSASCPSTPTLSKFGIS